MFYSILRGISTALLVTILTLLAGMAWGTMGLGWVSVSQLVDIGLIASCLAGGYRAGKDSGRWVLGGAAGAGYVALGTALLALFFPIQGWGFIQILGEGSIAGLAAGAFGAGKKGVAAGTRQCKGRPLNHVRSRKNREYESNDYLSSDYDWIMRESSQERKRPQEPDFIERSEYNCPDRRGEIWDLKESKDAEPAWDREERKELPQGSNYLEPAKNSKPWWE